VFYIKMASNTNYGKGSKGGQGQQFGILMDSRECDELSREELWRAEEHGGRG
jgi:hypothetical protein